MLAQPEAAADLAEVETPAGFLTTFLKLHVLEQRVHARARRWVRSSFATVTRPGPARSAVTGAPQLAPAATDRGRAGRDTHEPDAWAFRLPRSLPRGTEV